MAHSVLAGNYFTQIVAVMQQPTEKPLKVDNTLSLFLHTGSWLHCIGYMAQRGITYSL